jgi:hypothetical protein
VFFTVFIKSLVASIIWPNLFALTMLFILEPLALVTRSISVVINTETVRLIVLPIAIINVTVCMDQTTSSVGLIVLPIAFVQRSINPNLNTLTVFTVFRIPFTLILGTVVQNDLSLFPSAHSVITSRLRTVIKRF